MVCDGIRNQTNTSFSFSERLVAQSNGKLLQKTEQLQEMKQEQVEQYQKMLKERVPVKVQKVQIPSRLNSPLQTKLIKEANLKSQNSRNHSTDKYGKADKKEHVMTLSRICLDDKKQTGLSGFNNSSQGWFQKEKEKEKEQI